MGLVADEFGFLSQDVTLTFGRYVIKPKETIAEDYRYLKTLADSDEIIYPPPERTFSSKSYNEGSGFEERKFRPGTLVKIWPPQGESHVVCSIDGAPLPDNFRRWDGEFMIGMLSLFYQTSLQFKDWFHDKAMPLKSSSISIIRNGDGAGSEDQLSEFFKMTYGEWNNLGAPAQEKVLNALYFHSGAPFYKRGYERFFVEYLAIDPIWKAGTVVGLWSEKSRKNVLGKKRKYKLNRLMIMIDQLKMYDRDRYFGGSRKGYRYCVELMRRTRNIYRARNNLFHEGRWDTANRMSLTFENLMVYRMHNYTKRLILAFLGVRNSYTRLWWWGHAMAAWD